MDLIIDLTEALYEALGRKAIVVFAGVGLLIAALGFWLRSHYEAQTAICNSSAGRFAQFFSGNAKVDCGFASLMTKVGLGIGIIGILFAAAMLVWFWFLANRTDGSTPSDAVRSS